MLGKTVENHPNMPVIITHRKVFVIFVRRSLPNMNGILWLIRKPEPAVL